MNSLICFLTVFHVFKLIQRRLFIPKGIKRAIYLGIFLPLGDYLLRFVLGEFWFYSENPIFHSVPYHLLFWSILALLYWVYSRDLAASLKIYFPLVGLSVYILFSIFSTEHLRFWAPFTNASLHLDWINAGYLIPMTVAVFLRVTKRWSEFSSATIGRISLSVLVIFLIIAGVIRHNAKSETPAEYRNSGLLTIIPTNNLHTEWEVVNYKDGWYRHGHYHFVHGFQQGFQEVEAFVEYDAVQNVLLDTSIRNLCLFGFKNPVIKIEVQNEVLYINISELKAPAELIWLKQARIIRNRSGLIVDVAIQYGTFI